MKQKLILTNLITSQIITALLLTFAYTHWYPYSLSEVFDFEFHAKLIILANLLLGPFLLLIIYKKEKQGLKKDILIILTLQISVFLFGSYNLYNIHPAYAVFTVDRFSLVSAKDAIPKNARYIELQKNPIISGTRLTFAKMPNNRDERNSILMGHLFEGKPDLHGLPKYYEPYENFVHRVLEKSISPIQIIAKKDNRLELNSFLKKHGGVADSYAYIPLQNSHINAIWVLDKHTAQPIGVLDIDPWELNPPVSSKKLKNKPRKWSA